MMKACFCYIQTLFCRLLGSPAQLLLLADIPLGWLMLRPEGAQWWTGVDLTFPCVTHWGLADLAHQTFHIQGSLTVFLDSLLCPLPQSQQSSLGAQDLSSL